MQLVVLANEILKEEFLFTGISKEVDLVWVKDLEEFHKHSAADGYIDLLFEKSERRIELLKHRSAKPVIINSVTNTLKELNAPFVRINGWPGFLKRSIVEASSSEVLVKSEVEKIFSLLNKKTEWVADEPGFITPRIISMIINEAYFSLEENVSTKQEIDIAMKLGTNYPYGPFEWSEKIGLKNIYSLLSTLGKINNRYHPATLLQKDAKK
jgi:3-hydroxybutyryl-CoA dehydrogenase